jgi:hypothetical protein
MSNSVVLPYSAFKDFLDLCGKFKADKAGNAAVVMKVDPFLSEGLSKVPLNVQFSLVSGVRIHHKVPASQVLIEGDESWIFQISVPNFFPLFGSLTTYPWVRLRTEGESISVEFFEDEVIDSSRSVMSLSLDCVKMTPALLQSLEFDEPTSTFDVNASDLHNSVSLLRTTLKDNGVGSKVYFGDKFVFTFDSSITNYFVTPSSNLSGWILNANSVSVLESLTKQVIKEANGESENKPTLKCFVERHQDTQQLMRVHLFYTSTDGSRITYVSLDNLGKLIQAEDIITSVLPLDSEVSQESYNPAIGVHSSVTVSSTQLRHLLADMLSACKITTYTSVSQSFVKDSSGTRVDYSTMRTQGSIKAKEIFGVVEQVSLSIDIKLLVKLLFVPDKIMEDGLLVQHYFIKDGVVLIHTTDKNNTWGSIVNTYNR